MQDAEFRTVAHEAVLGFSNQENDVGNRKRKTLKIRSYFTSRMQIIEEVATVQVKLLVDANQNVWQSTWSMEV